MASRLRVFSSSVGTKILIGLTGLALFLYLILHIAGNVLVFLGRDTFNNYSHTLISNPLVPVATMTAYIVQVSLGDVPTGTIEFKTCLLYTSDAADE